VQRTQEARRIVVVVGLVVLAVLGAALAGPWHVTSRSMTLPEIEFSLPPMAQPSQSPKATAGGTASDAGAPGWILPLVLALVVGLLLWFLAPKIRRALAAWSARSEAAPDDEDAGDYGDIEAVPAAPVLEQGVARAARLLEDDRVPPGDAVIAAWVALEESAARTGVVRDRAQTASEFTVDVLGRTRADPAATSRLLQLYLAARYSEHRLTPQDVAAARDALARIADGVAHRKGDDE